MLAVMRDETADIRRRLEMAAAAAPYVHTKLKGRQLRIGAPSICIMP
jgi:hypothetical protein